MFNVGVRGSSPRVGLKSKRYFTIVNVSCSGLERCPAVFVAVMISVYVPGRSLIECETRPWKETLFVPA
jgi:hypothetical protein